jgi:deoxyribonuclease V
VPRLQLSHAHAWDLSPEAARRLQERLRDQVRVEPLPLEGLEQVAGIDASFRRGNVIGAVVVLDSAAWQPVDQAVVEQPIRFAYIPGLLSFRETPALLAALERLATLPDILMVDGHGLAHPRRFGIACHLGVLLDLPTIGVAKSILVGQAGAVGEAPGSTAELRDGDEVIGMAVRTRPGSRPVYVSIGHRVDLASTVRLVLASSRGFRLPEPARLAHQLATTARKGNSS